MFWPVTIWIALCLSNQYFHIWSTAPFKSCGSHKYFSRNLFFAGNSPTWVLKPNVISIKTDITAAFQFYFAVMYVVKIHTATTIRRLCIDHSRAAQRWWTTLSSLILSSYIPAWLITPCVLRSSFIAVSACPECPRGAAEWPVPPLTLRAAVTLHHPTLHLGWCGHLATGARVRRSWTRGYWEINRYASAQPSELPAWLAGWLPPPPPPLRPSLHSSSPLSLVMAKWTQHSSHFSTPRCTWISCYRIRNASACQGLAALEADVSVLSTGLHFHQYLDWEAERQQLIKFQKRISFLSRYRPWRSADQRLRWCTIAALPMNFFQHIGAFLRAITPPLQSSLGSSFGSFPHGSMWI